MFLGWKTSRHGQNKDHGRNNEEIATSRIDARDIVNAKRQGRLSNNSDCFPVLSSVFADAQYPKDFKPANLHKYDGKQDPVQWFCLYSTAINVVGGDTSTKVLYFPIVLEPTPHSWLESLKPKSIHSWEDFKEVFVDNSQGSLHRLATRHAIAMCKQEPGKTLRSYVKWFFDTSATITNVSDEDVIDYFHDGITMQSLYRDFRRNRPESLVNHAT
jgi:hypothetical protein